MGITMDVVMISKPKEHLNAYFLAAMTESTRHGQTSTHTELRATPRDSAHQACSILLAVAARLAQCNPSLSRASLQLATPIARPATLDHNMDILAWSHGALAPRSQTCFCTSRRVCKKTDKRARHHCNLFALSSTSRRGLPAPHSPTTATKSL